MLKLKLRLFSFPLRLQSLEIHIMNGLLSVLIKKRAFRTTKIAITLDETLSGKKEQMNRKTKRFFKKNFLPVG